MLDMLRVYGRFIMGGVWILPLGGAKLWPVEIARAKKAITLVWIVYSKIFQQIKKYFKNILIKWEKVAMTFFTFHHTSHKLLKETGKDAILQQPLFHTPAPLRGPDYTIW